MQISSGFVLFQIRLPYYLIWHMQKHPHPTPPQYSSKRPLKFSLTKNRNCFGKISCLSKKFFSGQSLAFTGMCVTKENPEFFLHDAHYVLDQKYWLSQYLFCHFYSHTPVLGLTSLQISQLNTHPPPEKKIISLSTQS